MVCITKSVIETINFTTESLTFQNRHLNGANYNLRFKISLGKLNFVHKKVQAGIQSASIFCFLLFLTEGFGGNF